METCVQGSRKQDVHLEEKSTLKADSSLEFTFSRERSLGTLYLGEKRNQRKFH